MAAELSGTLEALTTGEFAFELAMLEAADSDLDGLLERLLALLLKLPALQTQPAGLLFLRNPRGDRVLVAQQGFDSDWLADHQAGLSNQLPDGDSGQPALITLADAERPVLVVGLLDSGRNLGDIVLCVATETEPGHTERTFLANLGRAMARVVSRCLMMETLRVREIELEDARADAIRRLGAASEYRDNETGMHVMRMTHFATAIGKALGLDEETREILAITAPMHDVGKIGIADAILLKPGKLTDDEFAVMKTHTDIGARLLKGQDALIAAARDIAATHHEHWDGRGYPSGLKGEEIPILARICALADVFDALTSSRPYKEAWPLQEAIDLIRQQAGRQFDPAVVLAFDQALPDILRIRELYRDDIIDPNQVLALPPVPPREDEWVKWDDSLNVGIDVIDEHHRYLFDLTNDLYAVITRKRGFRDVTRVLKSLNQYAQIHFRAEEKMMAHYGFAALDHQKTQHHLFQDTLREFAAELHDNPITAQHDVLSYLRRWLIGHIRYEDAQLRSLIAA